MTIENIAFHTMGGDQWAVGPIYLKNLFSALQQVYNNKVKSHLLIPEINEKLQNYIDFVEPNKILVSKIPQRWSVSWGINGLAKRIFSRDIITERFLKKQNIEAVFGYSMFYKYEGIATISYFPDFQYKHLSQMFSREESELYDYEFREIAKNTTRIILWTEAVKKDFEVFLPTHVHKVRLLQPLSHVPEKIYNYDLNSILKLYSLPEKFIYLPNQFWKHKNHEIVFRAVKILKERGTKVTIVCTGNSNDYRHPTYFKELCQKLSSWRINDQIMYLGLIPHEHVFLLIRQSICLINPSLLEGWGSTVDEAICVGKKVLLSDIPAHREHNALKAIFFNPNDCEELVEKIDKIWKKDLPGPDFDLEAKARQNLSIRIKTYANSFISIVQEAIREIKG